MNTLKLLLAVGLLSCIQPRYVQNVIAADTTVCDTARYIVYRQTAAADGTLYRITHGK